MNLETKHIQWIFEAAGEHFTKEIERLELEIIRHREFSKEPHVTHHIGEPESRKERIDHAQRFLAEYRLVTAFCREARLKVVQKSAEEFADTFHKHFNFKV